MLGIADTGPTMTICGASSININQDGLGHYFLQGAFTPPCYNQPSRYDMGEQLHPIHYSDVIMGAMASQITSLTIVYTTVYSGADQRNHQSSVSLAFVRGIHRSPVNSPHKRPVTRKMLPFGDVIMYFTWVWLLFHVLHSVLHVVPFTNMV